MQSLLTAGRGTFSYQYLCHSVAGIFFLHCALFSGCVTGWQHGSRDQDDKCPSMEWNAMCRSCCEYQQIQCKCPVQGTRVGFAVPCCRNVLDQCDPCIIHQGCNIFDNCKSCNNGTWKAQDDFYIKKKYCKDCRQGWSGGDCMTCGGVIRRSQGHVALESYPINARCDWTLQVNRGKTIELRFTMVDLELDHNCRYDYIEVRDGESISSRVIGQYCGNQIPSPVRGSANSLHIRFVSDGYNNFNGFFAMFQEVSETKTCSTPPKPAHGDVFLLLGASEGAASMAQYLCYKPYELHGASQRTCLPNSTWSGGPPTCVKDTPRKQCPGITTLLHGQHKFVSSNTVEFSCKNPYVLHGNAKRKCLTDGSWSGMQPQCVRACREPRSSKLVRQWIIPPQPSLRRSPVHRQFSSSLQRTLGVASLRKDGAVLGQLPERFHAHYTQIEYECASPLYRNVGSSRRTCLKTGKWSGRHVYCLPVCGKRTAMTDEHWPWHAAVYRRLPSREGAQTQQMESQRGSAGWGDRPSAGWLWQLTCSGALVSQNNVVVAAHCVTEPDSGLPVGSAHVKVVMGKLHHSMRTKAEKLEHLHVAGITIHPNYNPTSLDSDLAVLKLRDKARLSGHVSPVCLPRHQGGEVIAEQASDIGWTLPEMPGDVWQDRVVPQTRLVDLRDVMHCERKNSQSGLPVNLTDNMLCGRAQSPAPVCPVATGGIALIRSQRSPTPHSPPSSNNQSGSESVWELLGLVSFGNEQQCSAELHTVYTRVTNFKTWIEKNIQ
ncbi:inactive serine protease PAMR1 [Denticeps clupeoides]|uniref:inactive serine protease PAMR1 n=1 Tax=Denticeps clupeoides TaxID=299321 RepID=UPI0010A3ED5F|nr:inactive serine protease PAMR1-like [Denticeps clupeoides]